MRRSAPRGPGEGSPRGLLRLVLLVTVVLLLTACLSVALLVREERRRFEVAAVDEARSLLVVLPDSSGADGSGPLARALRRPGQLEVVLVDEGGVAPSDPSLGLDDVPAGLRSTRSSQPVSARSTVDGRDVLVVGGATDDGVRLYLFFPEDRLVRRTWSYAAVAAALVVGVLALLSGLGWALTRRRLRDVTGMRDRERTFGAHLAHELRTPVGALVTAASLVDEPTLARTPDRVRGPVGVMRTEIQRLRGVVDDLLELSRLETGQVQQRPEPVSPAAVARSVVSGYGWSEVEVGGDESLVVVVDRRSLARVLLNLVGNAVRHGGPAARVHVRREAGSAVVEVVDDGPGPPERLLRDLEDGAPTPGRGGHGLGLVIARAHTDLLDGSLAFARAGDAGGTRASLRLPLGDRAGDAPAR